MSYEETMNAVSRHGPIIGRLKGGVLALGACLHSLTASSSVGVCFAAGPVVATSSTASTTSAMCGWGSVT